MNASRKTLSRNIDFETPRFDKLGSDTFRMVHVAHGDGAANAMAVGARRGISHRLPIPVNRFAAPKHWARIFENKNHQLSLQSRLSLLQQRVSSKKRFCPVQRELEPRLERRVVRRKFSAPCAMSFFQPQRV